MTKRARVLVSSLRRSLSVASRVLAASIGGYALTSLLALALALLLPVIGVNPAQATLISTMASFMMFAMIIVAVSHARTATRAWLWLLAAAVPPAVVVLMQYRGVPIAN